MKTYQGSEIRNVAVVGHAHSGKTTLIAALLHAAKTTPTQGRVTDGTAAGTHVVSSDFAADENLTTIGSRSDFNGDGFSDILFQNTSSGQATIWEMNGFNLIGGGAVSPNPGSSWHAIG